MAVILTAKGLSGDAAKIVCRCGQNMLIKMWCVIKVLQDLLIKIGKNCQFAINGIDCIFNSFETDQ